MATKQRTELSPDGQVWRPVVGFEGRYAVDDQGAVWSFVDSHGNPRAEAKRLKPAPNRAGRLHVNLSDGRGGRSVVYLHRAVLEAFVGPCPPGMEACHFDDDPTDNRLANLRWDTRAANVADRIRNGRQARGERHGSAKLVEADVLEIRAELERGVTQSALSRRFGVALATISHIATGKLWRHLLPAAAG